jgi:hypothetical protein
VLKYEHEGHIKSEYWITDIFASLLPFVMGLSILTEVNVVAVSEVELDGLDTANTIKPRTATIAMMISFRSAKYSRTSHPLGLSVNDLH